MMNFYSIPVALLLLMPGACRNEAIKDDFCAADATAIASAIELFAIETGSIPTSSQGLDILVKHPVHPESGMRWKQIMTKLPVDSWGNPFRYVPDCNAHPQKFRIISLGQDGVPSADDRVFSFTVAEKPH